MVITFGLMFQRQTPKPLDADQWGAYEELNIYYEALEQIEFADHLGYDSSSSPSIISSKSIVMPLPRRCWRRVPLMQRWRKLELVVDTARPV